jgi:tetratricopeptide (TPR) repeat protein
MNSMPLSPDYRGKCFSLILLSFFVFLIYSNTFRVPWLMDDYPNILEDPAIRVDQLSMESILNIFHSSSDDEKGLYRPISRLTFAINWFFHQDDVIGYHFVNLSIHILNALLLFNFLLLLFKTPRLHSQYPDFDSRFFIAFMATTLWAVHPIQIQAITYIVQRMTSLAVTFYLVAMLFYLKARLTSHSYGKVVFYCFSAMSYAFALGSKENAIMLPFSLILIEIMFFYDLFDAKIRKKSVFVVLLVVFLLVIFSIFALGIMGKSDFSSLLQGYAKRPFSLHGRLLTQPRVVIFYLYQIIYPKLNNYSFMHDFKISESFFDPWYTSPAIFFLFFAIVLAIYRSGRNPFLSFAVLFYFSNHLVESSFIPLEMVFEHRNYLPSMFLFLPLSIGFLKLIEKYRFRPAMRVFLSLSLSVLLSIVGLTTYQRNMVWKTDFSLWMDTYEKAPRLARPAHNLAAAIYQDTGQYRLALELNQQALNRLFMRRDRKAQTFFNIGVIQHQIGNVPKAMKNFEQAIEINPAHEQSRYNLSVLLAKMGNWEQAHENVKHLILKNPNKQAYFVLKGRILLGMGQFEMALDNFKDSLGFDVLHGPTLLYLGVSYFMIENYRKANIYLERARKTSPENADAWMCLIDNRIRLGDTANVERDIEMFFEKFDLGRAQNALTSPGIGFVHGFSFSPSLPSMLGEFLEKKANSFKLEGEE